MYLFENHEDEERAKTQSHWFTARCVGRPSQSQETQPMFPTWVMCDFQITFKTFIYSETKCDSKKEKIQREKAP